MKTSVGLVVLLVIAATASADVCQVPSFDKPASYAVTAGDVVVVADLDRDGAADILTSGNQVDQVSAFSVLRNQGDGTFANAQDIPSNFGERIEDVADLDGDGLLDLLVSNYWENGIATYRNAGTLTFGSGIPRATATHGGPTRAVDYDGDGVTDIVSFSFGSGNPVRAHLFRGRGDGSFDEKQTFETNFAIAALPSIRIDHGAPQFLVGDRSGKLRLLRFVQDAISLEILDAGPGFDLNQIFTDVNRDGIADIVVTTDGGSEGANNPYEWISVRMARADGTFGERRQLTRVRRMTLPTELVSGDFDGDGVVDLVASDFRATTLYFFRGLGTGDFEAGLPIVAGGPVNDLVARDLNEDGRLDLVTANGDRTVSVIMNGGETPCPAPRRRTVRH